MKIIIIAITIGFNLFADTFDIKCTGTDLVYKNSFSLSGHVNTTFNELDLDIYMRTNGYEYTEYNFEMTREFSINRIIEFDTQRITGTRILSLDKESDLVYINLILDYPGILTSTIRMKNGREFKSTCKQL